MKRTRITALSLVLLIAAAACSRDDTASTSEQTTGGRSETSVTDGGASGGDATSLDQGGFGDLEAVCQEGDASGATATGVSDTEIHVGTMTDKGYAGAPGLNEEMWDSAVAFAAWCNEHGGILGRKLVVDDLDVKLTEYEARVIEACERDFALVGGGAVFDEDPNGARVRCGLANIAGYVVSEPARSADLQVQVIPNPSAKTALARYQSARRDFPDSIDSYGVMAANLPAVLLVRDQVVESAESLGFEVRYRIEYAPAGETGWANFVADMKAKDIKILEYVGQPADFLALTQAMDVAGWQPQVVLLSGNFYDAKYAAEGGSIAPKLYVQSAFHPFDMADSNKATQDYLDMIERYNPGGKVALLGAQSMSAFLMFAKAASACGSELTADCLLREAAALDGWTGGGLHAPQTPGNTEPSPCAAMLGLGADGYFVDEEATAASDGIYNCDPENVFELSGPSA